MFDVEDSMFVMTRPRATIISILLSVFVFAVRDVVGCDFGTCDRNCSLSCAIYPGKNVRICEKDTGSCLGGCIPGWHGDHCNLTCSSNCIENICNQKDGHCTKGCPEKYQGDFCDKEIVPDNGCPPGQFGDACDHVCPPQCAVGSGPSVGICERDTGKCHDGCRPGWHGDHCNLTSVDNISNQGNRDQILVLIKGEMSTTHILITVCIILNVCLVVIVVVFVLVIVLLIVRYVRKAVWYHHAAPDKEKEKLLKSFNIEVKTETMATEIEERISYFDDYNKDSTHQAVNENV